MPTSLGPAHIHLRNPLKEDIGDADALAREVSLAGYHADVGPAKRVRVTQPDERSTSHVTHEMALGVMRAVLDRGWQR